ncbi:hypothetical protein DIJ64_13640 [Mycobacterium leprae]|uniref:Uncharacterized protein n=1 Tax=Mycobacterium leprae TaxID=1769 RepID=A0AAD0KVR8_MYCLR|nr:hypothetical protein [Mycobacterium leprae]AWV48723.1 hypothetical protein DIJ64_13640 [Mycobacterium leprae]OAR19711.1 hypothetical protein A8144_13695 [Mycobacterium leprae 3125609]OAX70161.1 hypothetical protein A3216_13655 [Mycobacterium leprae 7935681]
MDAGWSWWTGGSVLLSLPLASGWLGPAAIRYLNQHSVRQRPPHYHPKDKAADMGEERDPVATWVDERLIALDERYRKSSLSRKIYAGILIGNHPTHGRGRLRHSS